MLILQYLVALVGSRYFRMNGGRVLDLDRVGKNARLMKSGKIVEIVRPYLALRREIYPACWKWWSAVKAS